MILGKEKNGVCIVISEKLKDLLKHLPETPGVYLMKNEKSEVIYVGKAVSLKNRVRQYFQSSRNMDAKVRAMVSHIDEFEYIVTDTEMEALILENNLIKEYKPPYNILLRDDKTYPYIKVTTNEYFPRVIKVRKVDKDGAKYFGPYTNVFMVNESLETIREVFKIRTCKRDIRRSQQKYREGKERPCLEYYIGRCTAPCIEKIEEENYREMIEEILEFLSGKKNLLVDHLRDKMLKASNELRYEEAAMIRDRILNLEAVLERQKIDSVTTGDQDIIAIEKEESMACIFIFFVRNGKVVGKEHFLFEKIGDMAIEEVLSSFIKQFYIGINFVPKEILVDRVFEDLEIMQKWLREKRGSSVTIRIPKQGDKRKLMDLVRKNALETLEQKKNLRLAKLNRTVGVMKELQEFLGLEKQPSKIEAYDISNIQGVDSVGGQVVFIDGVKSPKNYRRYKIKSVDGPNDYASMEEIIRRRIRHGDLPDLILMDGGKGQVGSALKVLREENIDIPVLGMYKDDRHKTRGLTTEESGIELSKHSLLYQFIAGVQEEVHRFAISYHRSLREKGMYRSQLDEIKGIGKKRKMALLSHFKSIHKIQEADVETLMQVEGINRSIAEAIRDYFKGEKDHE